MGLFDGVHAAGPVAALAGDAAWLRAMVDFEHALALACADVGLISAAEADAVLAATVTDVDDVGERAAAIGNPAGPLVRALTEQAGDAVHRGATSQDVLDTAMVLVAAQSLDALLGSLAAAADRVAELASAHAETVQVGRTLSQYAPPVTFGLVAAGWLTGLDAAADRLAGARSRLALQFGGAVGTLSSLGTQGLAVREALARRLGLPEPVLPWHTERTRVAELAGALALTAGAVGSVAQEIVRLCGSDIGELREDGPPGSGGSTAMPHKHNPVAAICASACARRVPGLASTVYASMAHEHQRSAGAWHAEWPAVQDLLVATGSAVHWLSTSLSRLVVDADRMRANLTAAGGTVFAERVTVALADKLGMTAARAAVTECAAADDFTEALTAHLDKAAIADLLDPAGYVGNAPEFVRRALAAHGGRTSNDT
ncbi:lyase family protein [Labedaea rhizosphaerae]|uniref:3-carboxy-cis,cis-muconate cycloisomerase n=1 Tax=Labedaea rhizosphaerae TaxID=598644 RepID=A0A4R6SKF3_LABRH|nr:lyase family protein [Labedaea rhizosphaerae]TDQ01439.1 3-carboxy-cis,cis-muconate cycloisomerase [Labedaea rhizosphaerae]